MNHFMKWVVIAVAVPFSVIGGDSASIAEDAQAEAVNAPSGILELTMTPATIGLNGSRDTQQLIVTARFGPEDVRDVTDLATFHVADGNVAKLTAQKLSVVGDGQTTVIATVHGKTVQTEVTVTNAAVRAPISFHIETLAALTKAGCNMGACHGSPSGKGGFRLSLRGYDPPLDLLTLRQEDFGRRTNPLNPESSLLLKKPLMKVAHGGGRRLHVDDPAYLVLRDWIAEGTAIDPPEQATLERIEVFPKQRVLQPAATTQRLLATGFFSDGTTRDITDLTVFTSSSEPVAAVNEAGKVTKQQRGETTILAWYNGKMDTSNLTFLDAVPDFAWTEPTPDSFIDQHVNNKLQRLRIVPSELCRDDEFLRRASLDLTGQLPSVETARAYLADSSNDKRAKLIDRLLDSPEHADFWGLKWADVLRVNTKTLTKPGVHKFTQWISDSVDRDQPMDDFARELLTATGSTYEQPAANYWRATREPTDSAEATAQLFLGIRMQCAKCHNHPFEKWTQDDYYGVAAAFARVGRKTSSRAGDEVIFVNASGDVKQPRTGQTMAVRLLGDRDVDVPKEQDRRAVFAEWLTTPENPFFAKSIVNRVWGHLFGRGIVEPVDDFRDSNPPSNTELLDALAKRFVELEFQRKPLIREIMLSDVYQRSAETTPLNEMDDLYHSHAVPRMLTAEQLLDAICSVTDLDEKFAGLPPGTAATALIEPPDNHEFLKAFGQPQRTIACECERSTDSNLTQALQMLNGPTVHEKLRSDQGRAQKLSTADGSIPELLDELYLSAFSRLPNSDEANAATKHIESSEDRRFAVEDVFWAVMNSKEFLFQH